MIQSKLIRFLLFPALVVVVGPSWAREPIFDPNPEHPWNRLDRHLYSRTTADGQIYDQESLEPLFLPESKFLTDGVSHRKAVALLDEFLKERADEKIKTPLKRALLQRDLWAVFTTTAGPTQQQIRVDHEGRILVSDRLQDLGDTDLERTAQRRQLQKKLVQVMRRIALSPQEIDALPDNMSEAVKANAFPAVFNPKEPDRPFLPSDLLAKDGPWIAVTNPTRQDNNGFAAPLHVGFTKGRSVFVVLIRLPAGQRATEEYLDKIRNGDLPQFPKGTHTALLRRMLLIDNSGKLRASRLTESLQIRVFRELDTGNPYMFTLRRADLFAGRKGGLHPVDPAETSYFDFQTRTGDVFEMKKPPPAQALMKTCTSCHSRLEGSHGINTVVTSYSRDDKHPGLTATESSQQAQLTMDWTQKTYTWGLLQGLWETQP